MKFVHGLGNGQDEACVLVAARIKWLISQGLPIGDVSDELECACPLIRMLTIRRNDATPIDELQTWALTMVDRIVGSRVDHVTTVKRAESIALYAVRVMVADSMDRCGHDGKILRDIPDDIVMEELMSLSRPTTSLNYVPSTFPRTSNISTP